MAVSVATMTAAAGTLTVTANFTANDQVKIGNVTYKFVATPSAANDVDLGGSAATSLANLVKAINGTGTEGVEYAAGTAQVADVAASTTATVLTVTAKTPGTHGNNYILEEVTDGGSTYSISSVFTGGVGNLQTFLSGVLSLNQVNSEVQAALKMLTYAAD
jgi:hypothetical protein